jgi:hypothetical protein
MGLRKPHMSIGRAFEPNPQADPWPDIWGFRHTPDGR